MPIAPSQLAVQLLRFTIRLSLFRLIIILGIYRHWSPPRLPPRPLPSANTAMMAYDYGKIIVIEN